MHSDGNYARALQVAVPQFSDEIIAVPPIFAHLYIYGQKHLCAQKAFHFPAGVHSGLFERRAPLTDEDRLMIFLLADNVEIDGIDAVR